MEEHEVNHIIKNLSKLIDSTSCNAILLSVFQEKGILIKHELEILNAQPTPTQQSMKLYQLLRTKQNAYPVLMGALQECKQTGALSILEQLYISDSSNLQKYIASPPEYDSFLGISESQCTISTIPPCQVLVICTKSLEITSEKIRCRLGSRKAFFIDANKFQLENGGIPKCMENVITVVTCRDIRAAAVLNRSSQILEKFVVITCEAYDNVANDVLKLNEASERIKIVEDSLSWNDLSDEFQQEVLSRTIIWFREKHSLSDLFATSEIPQGSKEMMDIMLSLEPVYLKHLICNDSEILLQTDLLPRLKFSQLNYYIPRIVISRRRILKSIFNDPGSNDVILVSGIERYQLARLVVHGRSDTSRNQIRNGSISVKYIILQFRSDFEEICKIAKDEIPIHWLDYQNGQLNWVKSKGSISFLQRSVDGEINQDECTEDHFIRTLVSDDLDSRSKIPICISDTPGMGKSVFSSNVGVILNEVQCDTFVTFLVFSELIGVVKDEINKDDNCNLQSALLDSILNSVFKLCHPRQEFSSTFFTSAIKRGALKMDLILDGYDEINENDLDLANDCLKILKNSAPSTRLFVTTRPHLLHMLEETLGVLGHNLKPFTKSDQLQFLNKYWSLLHPNLDQQRLTCFSKSCLEMVKKGLTENERGIAGIPLQCLLIAEVFEEDAVAYSNPGNEISVGTASLASDIQVRSVGDLFERVIEKKINIYSSKYQSLRSTLKRDAILKEHIHCSLKLLFEETTGNLRMPVDNIPMIELLKVGIMEATGIDHLPRFIHRTFAEYFVALYAQQVLAGTDWITVLNEMPTTNFIFAEVLDTEETEVEIINYHFPSLITQTFKYKMIAYFLNSLLKMVDSGSMKISKPPGNLREFTHACIHDDLSKLWELSAQLVIAHDNPQSIFANFELIALSVMRSGLDIVEKMIDNFEKFKDPRVRLECCNIDPDERTILHSLSLLHLAAINGSFSKFEYILYNIGDFRQQLEESAFGIRYILHSCVENSFRDTEEQINGKIQIIRLVIRHNSLLLRMEYQHEESPLLSSAVHIKLLIELIKCGADVMATEEDGYSVLDVNAEYLPREIYHELVAAIPSNAMKLLAKRRTEYLSTALHHAVIRIDPMEETFKIFDECGADWNAVDIHGYTPFWRAVEYDRSVSCLEKMIEFGADWKHRDRKRRSALHVAAEAGNLEAAQFLCKLGLKIRARDWKGNTVLHYALRDDNENRRNEMVKLLLELGADVNSVNWMRKTVLDLAVETESLDTVKILCEKRNEVKLQKAGERQLFRQCVVS